MTTAEFRSQRINDALKTTNGDRAKASQLLNCSVLKLTREIWNDPDLKARWTDQSDSPAPVETLGRDLQTYSALPAESELTSEDLELAEQSKVEDRKIRNKLEKMGLTPEQMEIAIACREAGTSFDRGGLQIISGGAARMTILAQAQAAEIEKRLKAARTKLTMDPANCTEERKQWVEEEYGLMRIEIMLFDTVRKMMEMKLKAALVQAAVDKKGTVSGNSLPLKRAKPGYVVDVGQKPPSS
jgi:hypothetical protein